MTGEMEEGSGEETGSGHCEDYGSRGQGVEVRDSEWF